MNEIFYCAVFERECNSYYFHSKDKAKEFIPINENFQKYQFIEDKANREIRHQEDFELMLRDLKGEKPIVETLVNGKIKVIEIIKENKKDLDLYKGGHTRDK